MGLSVWPYTTVLGRVWPPEVGAGARPVTRGVVEGLPAVGRVLGLITGMIGTMPLNAVRGMRVLPRPALLELPQPEPGRDRSWFVQGQVRDWWLHGNAVHLVTSWGPDGLPASVMWLPVERVTIMPDASMMAPAEYRFDGSVLPAGSVVHVRRGADPGAPWRGVGVLEQHLAAWGRISDEEAYERAVMSGSAVPSIAVTTPNAVSQDEEEAAKKGWLEKFSGPARQPVFLPPGTEVKPLAWSPRDQQLNEARQLTLTDVANIANVDGYWLGASTAGYSYKSPGPMYLNLLRQTLQPIIDQLQGAWGQVWLPAGTELRFDTQAVLGDDMATTVGWLVQAVGSGFVTVDEARAYLGKSPLPEPTAAAAAVGDTRPLPAAETAQKVYLAVTSGLLSVPEGREMIRAAGADIDPARVPEEGPAPAAPAGRPEGPAQAAGGQDETIQEDE